MGEAMVPVGVSNKHLHLSRADVETLFGQGYQLHVKKDLSQPGQYACDEVVDLVTEKSVIKNVRILGPERKQTQVELALTDAMKLGLKPPVRDSGNLAHTPGIKMVGPAGSVELSEGVIIAMRHIHMSMDDATKFNVCDKQMVKVRCGGERGLVFENVLIRANPAFAMEMHIDTDEANASLLKTGSVVELIPE